MRRKIVAAELCLDPEKFEANLVDPKENFEDCTSQCRSIVDPGETHEGPEDLRSQWAKVRLSDEQRAASS